MVVFNELMITRDARALIIKVSKSSVSYFKDTRIKDIYVLSEKDITEKGISVEDVTTSNLVTDFANRKVFSSSDGVETAEVIISGYYSKFDNTLIGSDPYKDLDKHLWFVFVVTNELYDAASAPCDLTKNPQLGVTMYLGNIYNNFMSYVKELGNNCQIPQGMIDMLLRYKALNAAIDSGHYTQGINFFNEWFTEGKVKTYDNLNCGCHG